MFRALRITALTLPIAAGSLYLLDRNNGSITPIFAPSGPTQPRPLTLRAANRKLRCEQQTRYFSLHPSSAALGRVDTVRLPSNHPVEDEFSTSGAFSWPATYIPPTLRGLLPGSGGSGKWTLFGVYDGHAGWATSAYLREHLLPIVSNALASTPDSDLPGGQAEAIRRSFLAVDANIMQTALDAVREARERGRSADASAIAALAPAVAGSCALVAAWNPYSSKLLLACTGDSRAVLGKRQSHLSGEATYTAVPLSVDQAGNNPDEVARLNALHPNEPEMLKGLREKGRLFGLMVTRAFGDHRIKLETEVLTQIQEEQFGTAPRPHAVSQPYLTAEPEVTETVIQRGESGNNGDFVILASDGLWDHISSEDAVYCVDKWLERKRAEEGKSLSEKRRQAEVTFADEGEAVSNAKLFYLKDGYAEWKYKRDWLVAEDDNAATHLVRNVLGGKNRNFFCGLLTTYAPMSRNVRDDITVQVIFFGDVD